MRGGIWACGRRLGGAPEQHLHAQPDESQSCEREDRQRADWPVTLDQDRMSTQRQLPFQAILPPAAESADHVPDCRCRRCNKGMFLAIHQRILLKLPDKVCMKGGLRNEC